MSIQSYTRHNKTPINAAQRTSWSILDRIQCCPDHTNIISFDMEKQRKLERDWKGVYCPLEADKPNALQAKLALRLYASIWCNLAIVNCFVTELPPSAMKFPTQRKNPCWLQLIEMTLSACWLVLQKAAAGKTRGISEAIKRPVLDLINMMCHKIVRKSALPLRKCPWRILDTKSWFITITYLQRKTGQDCNPWRSKQTNHFCCLFPTICWHALKESTKNSTICVTSFAVQMYTHTAAYGASGSMAAIMFKMAAEEEGSCGPRHCCNLASPLKMIASCSAGFLPRDLCTRRDISDNTSAHYSPNVHVVGVGVFINIPLILRLQRVVLVP